MFKSLKIKRAQTLGEYVMTYFLVIAVISAMTLFIKRALQGRIYDARNYMMKQAQTSSGAPIQVEYEPYYVNTTSVVTLNSEDQENLLGGLSTGIYRKTLNETREIVTTGNQLQPALAK